MPHQLAIVTGTSRGIGLAAAHLLVERGWSVVGISRHPSPLDSPRYRHLTHDLGLVASLEATLGPALEGALPAEVDRLGIVNNAAAIGQLRGIERWDATAVLQVLAVNVVAPAWLMGWAVRADAKPERRPIRIVNVSSGAAAAPIPGLADYGGSKAALRLAGQTFAAEHPDRDLAVLSYEPGVVETRMQETARSQAVADFPSLDLFLGFARSGRNAAPEDVVPAIADFLESTDARGFSERRYGA